MNVKTKKSKTHCVRDTRRRVCENTHARAGLMIDYEEKVNGATISMRERVTK